MNGQRGQVRKLVGRSLLGLVAVAMAAVLLAPAGAASPVGDAEDAIMAAWKKGGGDTSTLGARKGDVYSLGDGFALDFADGKVFYTTTTDAALIYGPILNKYEQQGGPVNSDLGWPTINEVPGLAGPNSRVSIFSASDNPVIFWTPDHGAFVVRGPLNTAWDKLGSSGGVLGVPLGDETYAGDLVSQKFSGGEVSWNRKTKEFATIPAVLAERLNGLQVSIDPTAAINMAWRAAGGGAGPLGVKKGGQYPISGDGIAQDFVGGKIFFSSATGANAVEGDVLAKYELLGGPVSSDLGFPIASESDGGIGPSSRMATFSAADAPVIFWTPDYGSFVVRGAIKAAWDKFKDDKFGPPVDDQIMDGDVISQKFSGGKISWNRVQNTFSTDPANLAPLLSGLQVTGQNQPSTSTAPPPATAKKLFTWRWWYLVGIIPVLLLIGMLVLLAIGWRRRHSRPVIGPSYAHDHDVSTDYEPGDNKHWTREKADVPTGHFALSGQPPPEHSGSGAAVAPRISWSRGVGASTGVTDDAQNGSGSEAPTRSDEGLPSEQEVPDVVDTTPTLVVRNADLRSSGFSDAAASETYADAEVADPVVPEVVVPDDFVSEDLVPSATAPVALVAGASIPETLVSRLEVRIGRHAAVDIADDAIGADPAACLVAAVGATTGLESTPAGRPTIHLPLDDPYQAPRGYPIKASARFGLYYTSGSVLYHDTLAEIWFASEGVAQANGFIRAD